MNFCKKIQTKIINITLVLLALFLTPSLPSNAAEKLEDRYLILTPDSGSNANLKLYINKKSLDLDLSKTQNIRIRLKASELYSTVEPSSSFKVSLYEVLAGDTKKFISSQTLTVSKKSISNRIISIGVGHFTQNTKQVLFEIYDTAGNLINQYQTELTAYNLQSQVLGGEGVNTLDADCNDSAFNECQLDYLFQRITFEAKPQKQISTRVIKGEDGLYKVTIPVPRTGFQALGRKVHRKPGTNDDSNGGNSSDFGDTINVSNIFVGSSSSDSGSISYNSDTNQIIINNNTFIGKDGKVGIGVADPQGWLHIHGGDTSTPPLIINPGSLTTSPIDGAFEYDGTKLYFTKGSTRTEIGAQGPQGPAGAQGAQGPAGSGGGGATTTLSTLNPPDGSIGVDVNSNLILTFNTVIAESNGDITIHKVSDNSTIETIDSNDSTKVSYAGNKVTINPSSTFDYLTGYYVLIANNAFASGLDTSDAWAGISSTTDWNFTTASPANISVSSLSPADNATGVSRTGTFAITFNVPVTLNSGNVTFRKSSDNSIFDQFSIGSGQVTRSNGNRTVTFDPSGNMNYSNGYYIQIDGTAIENSYTGGEYFAGYSSNSDWNFTIQGPASLSAEESFSLAANATTYPSTTNVANMQSSNTPVTSVTMTNNKVAGDSSVVVAFNLSTNLPSTITLVGGTVITFGVDAVVPNSYANRYIVPTQEYSFYVDTTTYKLVISNEPSAFGVYTPRTITATFVN